jgi:hypothetical protein
MEGVAESLRIRALKAACRAYAPDVPVSALARQLGFDTPPPTATAAHSTPDAPDASAGAPVAQADAVSAAACELECAWFLEDHGALLRVQPHQQAAAAAQAAPTARAGTAAAAPPMRGGLYGEEAAEEAPSAAAPPAAAEVAGELCLDCKASRAQIVDASISETAEAERKEAARLAAIQRITF